MTEWPIVVEREGPRGGEYYDVHLKDGRLMTVSRKKDDRRVWLGRPDEPGSFNDQPGGIGNIDRLLDEWKARSDAEAEVLYSALKALVASRDAAGDSES